MTWRRQNPLRDISRGDAENAEFRKKIGVIVWNGGAVISWQPMTYAMAVDPNEPTRVFNGYLEYEVTYGGDFFDGGSTWKLVSYWRHSLDRLNDIHNGFYRGEGWKGNQANQFMHYGTNGLYKGEFGLPRLTGCEDQRPGAAGNVHTFSVIKSSGRTYLFTSDEWSHGVHRWLIK